MLFNLGMTLLVQPILPFSYLLISSQTMNASLKNRFQTIDLILGFPYLLGVFEAINFCLSVVCSVQIFNPTGVVLYQEAHVSPFYQPLVV